MDRSINSSIQSLDLVYNMSYDEFIGILQKQYIEDDKILHLAKLGDGLDERPTVMVGDNIKQKTW